MGVSLNEVFNALQIYMGSLYVNNFNDFGRSWQVNVQADTQFRRSAEDVRKLQVRNETGQMVPLDTLAEIRSISGPVMVIRYNMYPAAAINGNMAPGTSSGQAIDLMEQVVGRQLLPSMAIEWTELTLMQNLAGNTAMYVFALAVVSGLPGPGGPVRKLVAAAGGDPRRADVPALLDRRRGVMHMDINIFTQIGFVVLVGLASKNAILIVEFAKQQREAGMDRRRGHPGGLPAAPAADHDDLLRLHPGRRPAGHRRGGRGRDAAHAGHRRIQRHARRHPLWNLPHPGLLLRHRPPGGEEARTANDAELSNRSQRFARRRSSGRLHGVKVKPPSQVHEDPLRNPVMPTPRGRTFSSPTVKRGKGAGRLMQVRRR